MKANLLYFTGKVTARGIFTMKSKQRRSDCPVNFALEEFGDTWSLLIVRDILQYGKSTFGEFLCSDEKISTNILTSRLSHLVKNGILKKTPNKTDKRKEVYQLTQKGYDLYPIIREMIIWSSRYGKNIRISQELLARVNGDKK